MNGPEIHIFCAHQGNNSTHPACFERLDTISECQNQHKSHARAIFSAPVLIYRLFLVVFRVLSQTNTTQPLQNWLHRIREPRFGGVPLSLCRFFIGFGFSQRKDRFSTPRNTKKSGFSILFELFAPWHEGIRHESAKTTQNTCLGPDRSIRYATTRNAALTKISSDRGPSKIRIRSIRRTQRTIQCT